MELIVTEQYPTWIAYAEGQEFTEGGCFDFDLAELHVWVQKKLEDGLSLHADAGNDGDVVLTFINHIGIKSYRLIVTVDAADHSELMKFLTAHYSVAMVAR